MDTTKTSKSFYRIREVAAMLGVTTATIRYWEEEFPQLDPQRTPHGQRTYTPDDVRMCETIRELLHVRGLKIDKARDVLAEMRKYRPRHPFRCDSPGDALRLLGEVSGMSGDPHIHARIDAVCRWLGSMEGQTAG